MLDEVQTPSSDGSLAVTASGAISRRATQTNRRQMVSDEAQIDLVMKMGFSRKTVELAARSLRKLHTKVYRKLNRYAHIFFLFS